MAEGGGPGDAQQGRLNSLMNYRHNPNVMRAVDIGMRVLGAYLVFKGGKAAITRRSIAGGAVALGGLQLLSGKNPTFGNPLLTTAVARFRGEPHPSHIPA
jgi:hypothetical protein